MARARRCCDTSYPEQNYTIGRSVQTQLANAASTNAAAEGILENLGPLWSEAERLDAELTTARIELPYSPPLCDQRPGRDEIESC